MSSLVFCGRAPSAKTCSPKAVNAAAGPGANSRRFALRAREGAGYIEFSIMDSLIWFSQIAEPIIGVRILAPPAARAAGGPRVGIKATIRWFFRSEEHTYELQSLLRSSYA